MRSSFVKLSLTHPLMCAQGQVRFGFKDTWLLLGDAAGKPHYCLNIIRKSQRKRGWKQSCVDIQVFCGTRGKFTIVTIAKPQTWRRETQKIP